MQLFLLSSANRVHKRGDKEKTNSCSILKYIINLADGRNEYQVFSLKWPHYRQLHFNSLRVGTTRSHTAHICVRIYMLFLA